MHTSSINDDARKAWAGYGRFGGTIFRNLLVAAEVLAWSRGWGEPDETPVNQINTTGNISFSVLFFPRKEGGLFFKGGLGAAVINISHTQLLAQRTITETGIGAVLGSGFDVHLSETLSLTANADLILQRFDRIGILQLTSPIEASTVVLTVGLTRH